MYRCRLNSEGECGPGSGCIDQEDKCDPLICGGTCEWACGLTWDCDPSGDPSILRCTSDPTDEGCNAYTQNCPEGFKCMFKADFSVAQCAVNDENAKGVGDVCVVNDSGIDDCEQGAFCWKVNEETHEGTCTPLCVDGDTPCPPQHFCYGFARHGVDAGICIGLCDPLEQDCDEGELCIPSPQYGFSCALDASGEEGAYGDPCEFANACDPGLLCINPEYVEGCQAGGCCTPFCDITEMPDQCPGDSQECIPWYDMDAPPEYEKMGVCGIPQ